MPANAIRRRPRVSCPATPPGTKFFFVVRIRCVYIPDGWSTIRKLHRAWPKRDSGTSSSQIDYSELNDFRRTILVAEVRNHTQRVVEADGEISGADHQRELNNLTFVVILAQLLE